jgi:hypothetical protein
MVASLGDHRRLALQGFIIEELRFVDGDAGSLEKAEARYTTP